jgi:hypothetical protein
MARQWKRYVTPAGTVRLPATAAKNRAALAPQALLRTSPTITPKISSVPSGRMTG